MTYAPMYVLCGTAPQKWRLSLDGAEVTLSSGFPTPTGVEPPFFVLDAGPYLFDWDG